MVDRKVSDVSWRALMAEWNKQQVLDFHFTVGGYFLPAGVMRWAGIQHRPHLIALAERYGEFS